MLIKEYRIPLPMSVDEYRIAQLYMIQVMLMSDYYFVVSNRLICSMIFRCHRNFGYHLHGLFGVVFSTMLVVKLKLMYNVRRTEQTDEGSKFFISFP